MLTDTENQCCRTRRINLFIREFRALWTSLIFSNKLSRDARFLTSFDLKPSRPATTTKASPIVSSLYTPSPSRCVSNAVYTCLGRFPAGPTSQFIACGHGESIVAHVIGSQRAERDIIRQVIFDVHSAGECCCFHGSWVLPRENNNTWGLLVVFLVHYYRQVRPS